MSDSCRIITTLDDLDQVQDALIHFDWSHVAVEDKHRRAWLLVEDEGGVMWGTYGETEVTWRPAREILATYGPLRLLQDLSPALTFTEQEADRNAVEWCDCGTCEACETAEAGVAAANAAAIKRAQEAGVMADKFAAWWQQRDPDSWARYIATFTDARPCCHTTGPTHHPAFEEAP